MSTPVQTWRYYLPSGSGQEWAEIVLVSTGMFAAVSDWGNYAFAWRGFGDRDFREFVAGLAKDGDYVAGKLSTQEYDGSETLKAIKQDILRARRARGINADEAWDMWCELEEYDVKGGEFEFHRWLRESEGGRSNPDAFELGRRRYPHQARQFCQRILPRLAEALRAELEGEWNTEKWALGGSADTHAPGM